MSCIVRAQRRVCKRRVTLGHGLEWAHKIQTETQIDLIGNQDKKWSCQEGKITAIYICRLVESTNMSSWRFPAIYVQNDAPSAFRIDRYIEDLFRVGSLLMGPSIAHHFNIFTGQNTQINTKTNILKFGSHTEFNFLYFQY